MLIEALLVAVVVLFGSMFLLGGVLVLKGGAFHLWARWGAYVQALQSREWASTTGNVVRSVVTYTTGRGGRVYTPLVRYAYGAGGESFVSDRFAFVVPTGLGDEGLAAARAVVQRFPAGSAVSVFYDPRRPKRATLDRNVPPVAGPTLGWLLVIVFGAWLSLFLGVSIVRGPFDEPPELGDVPPLSAQFGGLAVGTGVLFVLAAGVRSIRQEERRRRGLIRRVESAKPALIHELREGELVSVSGRADDLASSPEEAVGLPFVKGSLVFYDTDATSFRRSSFGDFCVRDASGVVHVELRDTPSTFLRSRRQRIEGEVERWLDELRDDADEPIPAYPDWLQLELIENGAPVLLVGRAERDGDELVFRATPGDPTSLLVADGSREEVVERLETSLRRTRALLLLGGMLIVVGVAAMSIPA